MALCVEPAHHDSVERLGRLDIRKMLHAAISSVSPARDEAGEAAVLGGWRARVLETRCRREPPPRSPPV
jgi:hypothetical protein